MKVHPAADLFPMMADEELQALAADIKTNGLIHPIITDADGQLIDGRNRLAACKLAGIEPRIDKLNGQDPLAYIVSANLNRRNLSKGQQAMALAMIYPEPEKGGRGKKSAALKCAETSQFSRRRVEQAREVLNHSRELADGVLKGSTPLDEALATMREQQTQASSKEAQLERIKHSAPDLFDLVSEERMTVGEAHAAYQEREAQLHRIRSGATAAVEYFRDFSSHVTALHAAIKAGAKNPVTKEFVTNFRKTVHQLCALQNIGGDQDAET